MGYTVDNARGFTLLEIMVVVTIIGILAGIAIPGFNMIRNSAQVTRIVSDMRTYKTAFEAHALEYGVWPDDVNRGIIPTTMADYFRSDKFTETTPIGGNWDWDVDNFGFWAGLSIADPTAGESVLRKIDAEIDNGDLAFGSFRETQANSRYTLVLEEY